jgi:hypothetical protein
MTEEYDPPVPSDSIQMILWRRCSIRVIIRHDLFQPILVVKLPTFASVHEIFDEFVSTQREEMSRVESLLTYMRLNRDQDWMRRECLAQFTYDKHVLDLLRATEEDNISSETQRCLVHQGFRLTLTSPNPKPWMNTIGSDLANWCSGFHPLGILTRYLGTSEPNDYQVSDSGAMKDEQLHGSRLLTPVHLAYATRYDISIRTLLQLQGMSTNRSPDSP